MMRFTVFVLLIPFAASHESDQSSCNGPTTINYVYSEGRGLGGEPHTAKGSVLQGRPGRIGPRGSKGEKVRFSFSLSI